MAPKIDRSHLKIISYNQSLGGVRKAGSKNILWPCHEFRATIPARKVKLLNIFEETILRLSVVGSSSTESLAERSCLKPDLVRFIQHRLEHFGLIGSDFSATRDALELYQQWENDQTEYVSVKIYLDLIGGAFLPVVVSEPAGGVDLIDTSNPKGIKFSSGSIGEKKFYSARLLSPNNEHISKSPEPETVLGIINSFSRLRKRFTDMHNSSDTQPLFSSRSGIISVEASPDLVFLNTNLIIQRGSAEVIISDPFGFGFSSSLTETFMHKVGSSNSLESWVQYLKKKFDIDSFSSDNNSNDDNKIDYSYPEIERRLNKARNDFTDFQKINPANASEEDKREDLLASTILNLYESIEWTLRQLNQDYSPAKWLTILSSGSKAHIPKMLLNMAKGIGFNTNKGLPLVKGVNVGSYTRGVVEMRSLLALGIAAASDDNIHPFRQLAIHDSDFLSFIIWLKQFRDPIAHGHPEEVNFRKLEQPVLWKCGKCKRTFSKDENQGKCPECQESLSVQVTVLKSGLDRVFQMIKILYPSVKSTGYSHDTTLNLGEVEYENYRAKINYEKYFGLSVPSELAQVLLRVELHWPESNEPKNSAALVNALASALQIIFYRTTVELQQSLPSGDPIKIALSKAKDARLQLNEESELPTSIVSVKQSNIESALYGNYVTLGANFLAMVILLPDEILTYISTQANQSLMVVAKVIELRGHGNKSSARILSEIGNLQELKVLKESCYQIIKLLLGL